MTKALELDPDFAEACKLATIQNIHAYQDMEYHTLKEELKSVPNSYHGLPFHEYIQQQTPLASIKAATERMLWHQRLNHPSDYYLYNAHKHIDGVPQFKHMDPILETCPTCIQAKQTKEAAGPNTTRVAVYPFQGLSVDFSFSGMKSKNDDTRRSDYVGLNGETCWILITDHKTRQTYGDTRISKGSPIEWLKQFLTDHSPDCLDKYVYMDQGGELYKNPEVRRLFQSFGYDIKPTGAGASNQNGPVERMHLTMANGIRTALFGANLPPKFWPYAFHHHLRLTNDMASKDQDKSPYELSSGKRDNLKALRTFGCRVWVKPPQRRRAKFKKHSVKGIFLGYLPNTTVNVLWFDPNTQRVKIAKHVRFDEGMNDLPFEDIPPNVQHLQRIQMGVPIPAETEDTTIDEFAFFTNPFSNTITKKAKVQCQNPTLGITVGTDALLNRAYISDIKQNSSAARLFSSYKATCNKIRGAYIVKINDSPIFTQEDALTALNTISTSDDKTFSIELAPEKKLDTRLLRKALLEQQPHVFRPDAPTDPEDVPEISYADIRHIAALQHPELDFSERSITPEEAQVVINAINSHAITPEEQELGRLTRHKLKKLSTWPEWRKGEHKQLDQFALSGMYGEPQPRPKKAIVLRPHWRYTVKRDGTRRSRNCCDGSVRANPSLHKFALTYSSCVEQPVQRLFFALSAHMNYRVYSGDAQDAYAHSPPPEVPTYVSIDDQYADWYEHTKGKKVNRSHVLPVKHALQGHPESGRLWEEHINSILHSPELGFKSTIHDRCIYQANFKGTKVLLLRQVDDFSLAAPSESIAIEIYNIIGRRAPTST